MQKIKRAVLLCSLFVAVLSSQAQVSSADTMVQKLFTAIQTQNEKAFLSLFPNSQQMGRFMRSMMEQMFQSPEIKEALAADPKSKNLNIDSLLNAQVKQATSAETQAKIQQKYSEAYQAIIKKGEAKGVKWEEATLTAFTIDSTATDDDPKDAKMLAQLGIKNATGVVSFKSGDEEYQMNFDNLLYLPSEGGWFGGEFKEVIRKGEKFTPEKEEVTESAAPQKESKTKVKTPAGKAKTKSSATKTTTKTKAKS